MSIPVAPIIDGLGELEDESFEVEDIVEEDRPLAVVHFEPSGPPPYATGEDWGPTFRRIREEYEARRRRKLRLPASDDEVIEAKVTILESGRKWPIEELPQSPRGLMNEAIGDGWLAIAQRSYVHRAETAYVADSKAGAKKHHKMGDMRWPAADVEVFGIQGVMGQAAKFWATFERIDGKTKFISALVWDPVSGSYVETVARDFKEWRVIFKRPEKKEAGNGEG